MDLFHYFVKLLNVFYSYFVASASVSFVTLTMNNSEIIGIKCYTVLENKPYGAFYKIPYAEPPIGKLRFKPPLAVTWFDYTAIYNYSKIYRDTCATSFSEDCLYLSVFMPIRDEKTNVFPVIVWLEENSALYGPDFLIDEQIIIVTVSFRVSVFGFLNTGDDFATGNMGAKDITLALKWIRGNIIFFNGDPNKVTVMGSGAAASTVASLPLTPAAEDLYARLIVQSSSALSPADYRSYHFEISNKLFWKLHGPFKKINRTKFYEILGEVSAGELKSASQDLFDSSEVRDCQRLINSFGPTVENSKRNAFMYKHPLDVYKGKMTNNNGEMLIGYTSLESLYKLKGFANNKKLLKYLNYNFQYLLPFEGRKDEYGSMRYKEIRRKIMDFYFVNGTIAERSLRRYGKYLSDQVIYPVLRQARLHAAAACANVYLYRFSFKGCLNVVWSTMLANVRLPGATGGDETCYQFRCKSANDVYSSPEASTERQFIKKIARLFANFAKYGNPTPVTNDAILGPLHWDPLQNDQHVKTMNLGKHLRMVNVPEERRMTFWDNLKTEYFSDSEIREE